MVTNRRVIADTPEGLEKLKRGALRLAGIVSSTLGPGGRNVILGVRGGAPHITNDGVSIAKEIFFDDEIEDLGARAVREACQKTNDRVGDGPQPLYSKVLTPSGFVEIGSLKVGDAICGTGGTQQTVLGVYPKGKKQVFKVKFGDGREVECCEDHLWSVTTRDGAKKLLTTRRLLDVGVRSENGDHISHKFFVPVDYADFNTQDLSLDPYLVGVLIGDGSLNGEDSTEISLGLSKEHILEKILLPEGLALHTTFVEERNYFRVKIVGKTKEGKTIRDFLKDIGLFRTLSATKHIPKQYLYSDKESRLSLLQGLCDTDGHVNNRGLIEYSTISEQLHEDILELSRGLGRSTYSYLRQRETGSSYSMNPIYRICELKGDMYGNKITAIEPTDKYEEMQCIKVSNEDNLYFTDDYILTHNTTTTAVFSEAIIRNVLKNHDPKSFAKERVTIQAKRDIDEECERVIAELDAMATPVTTSEQLVHIAQVSVEDQDLGRTIGETMWKLGKNGVMTAEDSQGTSIEITEVKGLRMDNGFAKVDFVTHPDQGQAIIENARILVTSHEIIDPKDILPLIQDLLDTGTKDLVIVARAFSPDALATLWHNAKSGVLRSLPLQAPYIHMFNVLKDIAVATGATYIDLELKDIKDIKLSDLGTVKRTIATRQETFFQGVTGDTAERVAQIEGELKHEPLEGEKRWLEKRLANLTGGMAVVKVGGWSDQERKYKKDKVDDALNAARAAFQEGTVPGGGLALKQIAEKLPESILTPVLLAPYKKIQENAGGNLEIEDHIIDPVKVTKIALREACSVAGTLITASCAINHQFDKPLDQLLKAKPQEDGTN